MNHTPRGVSGPTASGSSAILFSSALQLLSLVTHFPQHHQALAFVAPQSLAFAVSSQPPPSSSSSSSSSLLPSIFPFPTPRHSSSSSLLHENNNKNSLILARENAAIQQQLNEAFSSLNDRDKYEAVLTGLCAKIIDGGEKNANRESLLDPMRLMEEMNSSGIIAGPRGIIGLIDVRVDQKQNTQIYITAFASLSLSL